MFAVIAIPNFSLQAVLRHAPDLVDGPVALVSDDSARAAVAEVTQPAREAGVVPGLTSTQAKARCDQIAFRTRSVEQEQAAQEVLLECAYLSAAYLELTAPGICTLDLRGLPLLKARPLAEALKGWAGQLRQRLAGFSLRAQIGIAATPELALQAAQATSEFCLVEDPEVFWRKLPVRSLGVTGQIAQVLRKWGIHTAAEFFALGKAAIAERLGVEGLELFERTRPDAVRPLRLTMPRLSYCESFQFEQRVETLEPLLFIVRRLLEQLARRIELVSLSVEQLAIDLNLESGDRHKASLRIASPTRDVNVLFRILHNYLETVRTPAAVVGVSIEAKPCEVEDEQFQLFETSVRDPNRFFETIGRIGATLGPDRVGTPACADSYRPDAFRMSPPAVAGAAGLKLSETSEPKRGLALRRFRPALPATVRLKEGAPVFVSTPGPAGAVVQSRGPWRSSGNWWESLWAREEWDVQMKDGGLYRIYLENNRWYVEGAYD